LFILSPPPLLLLPNSDLSGYCFVHYEDKRDAEEAIRALDNREWGSQGRRLKVEYAKDDAKVRTEQAKRRAEAVPNETLFVAGFDARKITTEMLERAFEGFGKLKVRNRVHTRLEFKIFSAFLSTLTTLIESKKFFFSYIISLSIALRGKEEFRFCRVRRPRRCQRSTHRHARH
jgi:RNA recognition motif-containing protein